MMTSGFARLSRARVIPKMLKYSRSDGREVPSHPLELQPQDHDHIGVFYRRVDRRRGRDTEALDLGGDQRRRAAHRHLGAQRLQQQNVRPENAAM